jgi:hypothetical protein
MGYVVCGLWENPVDTLGPGAFGVESVKAVESVKSVKSVESVHRQALWLNELSFKLEEGAFFIGDGCRHGQLF